MVLAALACGVFRLDGARDLFIGLHDRFVYAWSWRFEGSTAPFLPFAALRAIEQRDTLQLGPEDESSAFVLPSWSAMLFSAGVSIRIRLFGIYAAASLARLGARLPRRMRDLIFSTRHAIGAYHGWSRRMP